MVSASCGRKTGLKTPPSRSRNGTRAGDSSSRTCASVICAKVAIVAVGRPPRAELGAVRAAARQVRARARRRRRGRRASRSASSPAVGRRTWSPPQPAASTAAASPAASARAHHSSRSPATMGSRMTRRATTAVGRDGQREQAGHHEQTCVGGRHELERGEARRRRTRPAARATSALEHGRGEGGGHGDGERRARRARAPIVARSPPAARSSATAPRRSRAVIASAWISA